MKQNSILLMSSRAQNDDKTSEVVLSEKSDMPVGTSTKIGIVKNVEGGKVFTTKTHPWRAYGSKLKG